MEIMKPNLTPDQMELVARRCGGKFMLDKWRFPTPQNRAKFDRLVAAGKTKESLLRQLINMWTSALGITSIVALLGLLTTLFTLWLWGGYQALIWLQIIPLFGTSTWSAFHLSAALAWCGFNILTVIHKLGIVAILTASALLCAYILMNTSIFMPASPQALSSTVQNVQY